MRYWKAFTASLISLGVLATSAQAATSFCTTPAELSALRTAAVQQELMVAGLTCQAIDAYNQFVIAYRPELQKSDSDLKAYFVRRNGARGEADYDTFKTKLANLSSLSDIANSAGYCANARAAFDMAMRSQRSLASFVADQRLLIALPEQQLCVATPTSPVTAAAEPAQSLRLAAFAPDAVAGVPSHNPPASSYGAPAGAAPSAHRPKAAPPPPPAAYQPPPDTEDNDQDYDDGDEDAAPIPPALLRPERPAVIQAQRDPAYGPTGWPPGWGPRPYARWYDRGGYYDGR